jgi:hypothetical protein
VMRGDRLPEPPERLPAPFELAEEELFAWRLHREEDPLEARRHPSGRYRFDAPSGEYAPCIATPTAWPSSPKYTGTCG